MKGSDPGEERVLSVITNNANIGLGRRAELGSPGLNGNDCKVNSKFAQLGSAGEEMMSVYHFPTE